MPNQQLTDYITKSVAQGASREEIKSALLGAGWQEADVNEGLLAVFPVSAHKSAVGGKSKALIMTVSALAALLLAGGGFAYWYFVYEPKQQTTLFKKQVVSEAIKPEQQNPSSPKTTSEIQSQEVQQPDFDFIFSKVGAIKSLQYDIVATSSGVRLTGKNWEEPPYLRGDGQNPFSRVIVRSEGYYRAESEDGKFSFFAGDASAIRSWFISGLIDLIKKDPNKKVLGSDIVNGEKATMLSYSFSVNYDPALEDSLFSGKIWISEETGLPIKSELIHMEDIDGAMTTFEYSNFSFNDIPDSIFDVPQDRIIQ